MSLSKTSPITNWCTCVNFGLIVVLQERSEVTKSLGFIVWGHEYGVCSNEHHWWVKDKPCSCCEAELNSHWWRDCFSYLIPSNIRFLVMFIHVELMLFASWLIINHFSWSSQLFRCGGNENRNVQKEIVVPDLVPVAPQWLEVFGQKQAIFLVLIRSLAACCTCKGPWGPWKRDISQRPPD